MPHSVNFDSTEAVSQFVTDTFSRCYPNEKSALISRVFSDIDAFFKGRNAHFRANDLKYHNLRHTLMVAACMSELLEGYHLTAGSVRLSSRDFELGMVGVLLHDAGYLKLWSDESGTGAKYTFCHILRSCAFAASYLPSVGATADEVEDVIAAINCTGATSEIGRLAFKLPSGRILGAALATADYVAQLADPLYPSKLVELFAEFRESDDYARVPMEKRPFKTEQDLVRLTPGFWKNVVRPKLENEFGAAYRMLERPLGSGRNTYLDRIEANFAAIESRAAATAGA
jgi:hypothetical protein